MNRVRVENIAIVLQKPRFSENVGAAARAARNMGIRELIVVNPEKHDMERVLRMATRNAVDVVERMQVHTDLGQALSPFGYVVGTTARTGGQRESIHPPSRVAGQLISISQENRVAVLFGPEDRGLSNEDLRRCHILVNIPTAEFSSLNLAQAVMVMSYEIFRAGTPEKPPFIPRLANRFELDGMYDQWRDVLVKIDYINHENPDYWMHKIRQYCTRLKFTAKEVSIIRGICRQINWFGRKNFQDGYEKEKGEER